MKTFRHFLLKVVCVLVLSITLVKGNVQNKAWLNGLNRQLRILDESNTCKSNEFCSECAGNKCIQCKGNNREPPSCKCKEGYYHNETSPDPSCKHCYYTCKSCHGPSIDDCDSCPPDRVLVNGTCVCPDGYYEDGVECKSNF